LNKRLLPKLLLAGCACFIAPIAIAILIGLGYCLQVSAAMPKTVSGISAPERAVDVWSLSLEQQQTVAELGYPESFAILFYDEERDAGSPETIRFETWSYYSRGIEVTFINGEKAAESSMDPFEVALVEIPYRPEQFTAYMNLAGVVCAAKLTSFTMVPLERRLLPSGETYFADRLTFGMKDGELRFLETLPLVEEE
jgi:hypothetical protein